MQPPRLRGNPGTQFSLSSGKIGQDKFDLIIHVRVVASAVLLSVFAILHVTGALDFPFLMFSIAPLASIFFNQPWPWIIKKAGNNGRLIFFINQSLDIILITWGIHFLGGMNFFSLMLTYPLIFIFTGTVLGSASAYWMANLSFVAYLGLVLLESHGIIPVVPVFQTTMPTAQRLVQTAAVLPFFNLIAYFASFLTSALRDNVKKREWAEVELRRERENLEKKVRERTAMIEEAQEQLRRYAEKLEESNESLKQFSAAVSHDLQEPLMNIRLICDVLDPQVKGHLDADGLEYFYQIRESTKRLQAMVKGLLEYANFTRDDHSKAVELELEDILQEIVKDYEGMLREFHARVEWEKLPKIKGQRVRVRQLFQNFISNALKYRKPDTPPHIKIYGETLAGGESVIRIEDNGVGFESAKAGEIFQPFKRLHPEKSRGLGLGLALCKKIAENYGWGIEAQGQPGKGALFTLILAKQEAPQNKKAGVTSPGSKI